MNFHYKEPIMWEAFLYRDVIMINVNPDDA